MDISLVHQIIVITIDVVCLLLGFLVYSSNPKGKINQSFSLMSLFLFLWITFGYLSIVASFPSQETKVIFARINMLAVCFFFIPFYFFSVYFPVEDKKRHPRLDKAIVAFWSLLAFLTIFTNLVLKGIVDGTFVYGDILGQQVFLPATALAAVFAVFSVSNKVRKLQGMERKRALYLLVGLLLLFIFNVIFNVLGVQIFGSNKYYAFGDYSAIFLLLIVFYSVVNQQLFGVKVLLTYAMVAVISTLLFVDLFAFTTVLSLQILKIFTLLIFLYFGRSLVRSVTREIKLKEQLQDLNTHLQDKVDEQTKEIKSAYEVEKKARIKLEELDKVKDEFISTAAHQLRTPLAGTRWALKSLLDGTIQKDNERKDMLEKIYESNNNLITIVGDLLDTSSIENKSFTYEFKEENLSSLIKEVVSSSIFLMKNKKIKISYHEPEDDKTMMKFDRNKLSMALRNIMSNAVDYTPDGGEIEVNFSKENNQAIIAIKDTGIGISPKDRAHIFEKFYRGANAKKTETDRSGLGLYISKQIIEKHGGTISLDSKEGEGTKVVVRMKIV